MPRTPVACAAHRAHVVLGEAHRLAVVGEQHDVVLAVGERDADQVVALVEVDGDDAARRADARTSASAVFFTVPCAVAMNTKWFSSNSLTGSTAVIFSPSSSGNRLTIGLPRAVRLPCGSS